MRCRWLSYASTPAPWPPFPLLIYQYYFFAMNYFGSSACEISGQTIGKQQQQQQQHRQLSMGANRERGAQREWRRMVERGSREKAGWATLTTTTTTTPNEYDAWNNNNEMTTKGTDNKRIAWLAGRLDDRPADSGWGGRGGEACTCQKSSWPMQWGLGRRECSIKIKIKCDFWSLWKLLISNAWVQLNEIGALH